MQLAATGRHIAAVKFGWGPMTATFSGNYPIEHRAGEIERLLVQSQAMAPEALAMLERFGPMQGWKCLDIGCGPGGITDLLGARVGPAGRVIGLDRNAEFLQYARKNAAGNVEFRLGDAYASDLPAGTFDLVHMRFVASTAGNPQRLLREAARLARPGGIVALQEPDGSTLYCYPPHPAWEALKAALLGAFKGVGADLELAKKLYFLVHHSGLRDVQYRTALLGVRSTDPMVDYLPATVESLRATILKLGLIGEAELAAALADCRAHLATPGTSFTMYALAQVWGRTAVPSPLVGEGKEGVGRLRKGATLARKLATPTPQGDYAPVDSRQEGILWLRSGGE